LAVQEAVLVIASDLEHRPVVVWQLMSVGKRSTCSAGLPELLNHS
jgi:hypothetical protein